MSSRRFPGKVLAPFRGRPIIDHVLTSVHAALPDATAVVLTSDGHSDEPLVAYLDARGTPRFRGPLEDVLTRFQACLETHPCRWVLRITADSPLLNRPLLQRIASRVLSTADLVTTTAVRTFPIGQNAELIRSATLRAMTSHEVTSDDREHVTRFVHRHPQRFQIEQLVSPRPSLAALNLSVDTVEDLHRLERLDDSAVEQHQSASYWEHPE